MEWNELPPTMLCRQRNEEMKLHRVYVLYDKQVLKGLCRVYEKR